MDCPRGQRRSPRPLPAGPGRARGAARRQAVPAPQPPRPAPGDPLTSGLTCGGMETRPQERCGLRKYVYFSLLRNTEP